MDSEKTHHRLFFGFKDGFISPPPHTTPIPKVHAVSIDPDVPLYRIRNGIRASTELFINFFFSFGGHPIFLHLNFQLQSPQKRTYICNVPHPPAPPKYKFRKYVNPVISD